MAYYNVKTRKGLSMSFDKKMLDELLKGYKKSEDIFGENGTYKKLKRALVERILEAELT